MKRNMVGQEGQVALVALSITAVLTVLSSLLIQRSVVEQKLAGQVEETARALNLAEAGVEEILNDPSKNGVFEVDLGDQGSRAYKVSRDVDTNNSEIREGRTRDFWVQAGSTLRLGWSSSETGSGVLVTVMGDTGIKRYLYKRGSNTPEDVSDATATVSEGGTIDVDLGGVGIPELVRVKALWSDITLSADGNNLSDLSKNVQVEVEAETETGATSNVFAEKSAPQLPSVFDYALFSGSGINK